MWKISDLCVSRGSGGGGGGGGEGAHPFVSRHSGALYQRVDMYSVKGCFV